MPVSGPRFNPVQQFTRSGFSNTEYGYSVLIRQSKIIQLGQCIITALRIKLSSSPLCPVQAVICAFILMPQAGPNSQGFCYQERHCIIFVFSYKSFMTLINVVLFELRPDPHDYGTLPFVFGELLLPQRLEFHQALSPLCGIGNRTLYFCICICL